MRPFESTIPFDLALRRVCDDARSVSRTETLALPQLDGRVLAREIVAHQDVPAFDRAAMDGYAVQAADTTAATAEAPVALRRVGRLLTGEGTGPRVESGTCVEIATGAPLPPGVDAVVMVEHTARDGDVVLIQRPAVPRQHVGARGGDIRAGEVAVAAGTVLTPARVGAIAAIGIDRAQVFAKPRVAVMCTGDEVVSPGRDLQAGQVYNVNSYTLEALVRRHGGDPVVIPTTGDSIAALESSLDAAGDCELIVSSGGSSVGEHDLVIDVLRARGEVIFHGVSIKPGKPTVFGRIGTTRWLGLSGYPASCLSNAYVLLVPLLRRTARLPEWQPRTVNVPLARRISSPVDRLQFYSVRIEHGEAVPAFKASGDITSMAHAEGHLTVPIGTDSIEAGTMVEVRLYE